LLIFLSWFLTCNGTKWPKLCLCAVKKLLTHSLLMLKVFFYMSNEVINDGRNSALLNLELPVIAHFSYNYSFLSVILLVCFVSFCVLWCISVLLLNLVTIIVL